MDSYALLCALIVFSCWRLTDYPIFSLSSQLRCQQKCNTFPGQARSSSSAPFAGAAKQPCGRPALLPQSAGTLCQADSGICAPGMCQLGGMLAAHHSPHNPLQALATQHCWRTSHCMLLFHHPTPPNSIGPTGSRSSRHMGKMLTRHVLNLGLSVFSTNC